MDSKFQKEVYEAFMRGDINTSWCKYDENLMNHLMKMLTIFLILLTNMSINTVQRVSKIL